MVTRKTFLKSLAAVPPLCFALGGCSALGAFNALIPQDGGTTLVARDVTYGPDPRQKLDIYVPANATTSTPVIVFVYGGSWNSGSKQDYGFAARAFASRGFTTVVFDYRLVPEVRYPAFVDDTAKAVAWTHRTIGRYGGDAKRLYLMGHSAGAYNAMMVTVAPEFLAAEGLSPKIIRATAGLSGPYDFLPLAVDASRQAFAGVADLEGTQPVNRVERGQALPPILLATGDADDLVEPRNTRALAEVLRKTGHTVEETYYPGVDHVSTLLAISRPLRGRAPVIEDVTRFFAAH